MGVFKTLIVVSSKVCAVDTTHGMLNLGTVKKSLFLALVCFGKVARRLCVRVSVGMPCALLSEDVSHNAET